MDTRSCRHALSLHITANLPLVFVRLIITIYKSDFPVASITLPLVLATLALAASHCVAVVGIAPVGSPSTTVTKRASAPPLDQCLFTCFTQSAQAAGCGNLSDLTCVCNLDHGGPNFFGKTMACVVESCGSNQSNITASYYFGTLCGGGGAPSPAQSTSYETTSTLETSTSTSATTASTTRVQETSSSARTSTISSSISSTFSSESYTRDSSSSTPASALIQSSIIIPGPSSISISTLKSNVTTTSGHDNPTESATSSSGSGSSISSSIPRPTLPSSKPHSQPIPLTVLLPVVISLVLLAAVILLLRRRAKRGMLVNRAHVLGSEMPPSTSLKVSEEQDVGSLRAGRGHDAMASRPTSSQSRGSSGSNWLLGEDFASREAHASDVATIPGHPPLETSGQGQRAILGRCHSEPLKPESTGAHNNKRSTRLPRAGAQDCIEQATVAERDVGIRRDADTPVQDKDCMEPQPTHPDQRHSSHVPPDPADGAADNTPDSEGQVQVDSEPRMLRLVLPWAFGQHLLSLAAANPPPSGQHRTQRIMKRQSRLLHTIFCHDEEVRNEHVP
ncbi:hypothetical protein ONZ51_g11056 [Trametes cubensis]|uniref:CFEM domain-containing protein n=1 Tax=Trametes cubensis TaxID=1111947 RepID=A0AAD7TKZ5_9APHY|nr:hypothetical protein ONZ51_g11056 [Trametes cubensis]